METVDDMDIAIDVNLSTDTINATTDHDEIQLDLETAIHQGPDLSSLLNPRLSIPVIQITEFDNDMNEKQVELSEEHLTTIEQNESYDAVDGSLGEQDHVVSQSNGDILPDVTEADGSSIADVEPVVSVEEENIDNNREVKIDDIDLINNNEFSVNENPPEEGEQSNETVSSEVELDTVDCSIEFSNLNQKTNSISTNEEDQQTGTEIVGVENSQSAQPTDSAKEVLREVSLSNIIITQKAAESDSDDSEFDFDLPTTVVTTEATQPSAPVTISTSTAHDTNTSTTQSTTKDEDEKTVVNPVSIPTEEASKPMPSYTQKPMAVIRPQSQAHGDGANVPQVGAADTRTQRVLKAAQDEWDNVTTIQAGYKDTSIPGRGVEPTAIETVAPMSPYELNQIFMQEDFSEVRPTIRPCVERRGMSAFMNMLFGGPKMNKNLNEERHRTFCIAATQLCNEKQSHIRTLQTIYRSLTGSKFDCARTGSHWQEIGFQGNDPATDLRGTGLLGLMNLLYILKDPVRRSLASDIYRLSLHPTQNFPFCIMGINLSRITIQALREDILNKECNRRGDVMSVVNDFYTGLYLQVYLVWKSQCKTISDSGYVIKDIELWAKKNPKDLLRQLEDYFQKKKTNTMVVEESGGDNFTNVCED